MSAKSKAQKHINTLKTLQARFMQIAYNAGEKLLPLMQTYLFSKSNIKIYYPKIKIYWKRDFQSVQ